MTQEIWRDVKGYEGLYQVSNLGNVKSVDRTLSNGAFRMGQIKRQFPNKNNKLIQVMLSQGCKLKLYYTHRLVAEAFVDNPNNFKCITHLDGDIKNNSADNLEWVEKPVKKIIILKTNSDETTNKEKDREKYTLFSIYKPHTIIHGSGGEIHHWKVRKH